MLMIVAGGGGIGDFAAVAAVRGPERNRVMRAFRQPHLGKADRQLDRGPGCSFGRVPVDGAGPAASVEISVSSGTPWAKVAATR